MVSILILQSVFGILQHMTSSANRMAGKFPIGCIPYRSKLDITDSEIWGRI